MRYVDPLAAVYPMSLLAFAGPGSLDGPNDGQDAVQCATVNQGYSEIAGGLAYLAALTIGPLSAPLNNQPPALTAYGVGSGVSRLATVAAGTAGYPDTITGQTSDDLGIRQAPPRGVYCYVSPIYIRPATGISTNTPQWATGTYALGDRTFNVGRIYVALTAGLDNGAGPTGVGGSSGAVIWYNLTGNTQSGASGIYLDAVVVSWSTGYAVPLRTNLVTNGGNTYLCTVATGASSTTPGPTGAGSTDGGGNVWVQVLRGGQWVWSGAELVGAPWSLAGTDGSGLVPLAQLPVTTTGPAASKVVETDLGGTIDPTLFPGPALIALDSQLQGQLTAPTSGSGPTGNVIGVPKSVNTVGTWSSSGYTGPNITVTAGQRIRVKMTGALNIVGGDGGLNVVHALLELRYKIGVSGIANELVGTITAVPSGQPYYSWFAFFELSNTTAGDFYPLIYLAGTVDSGTDATVHLLGPVSCEWEVYAS